MFDEIPEPFVAAKAPIVLMCDLQSQSMSYACQALNSMLIERNCGLTSFLVKCMRRHEDRPNLLGFGSGV